MRLSNCSFSQCLVKWTAWAETNHLQKILKFGLDNHQEIQLFSKLWSSLLAMPQSTESFKSLWASIGTSHIVACKGSARLGWQYSESGTVLRAAPGLFCQSRLRKENPSHFSQRWPRVAAVCSLSAPAPLMSARRRLLRGTGRKVLSKSLI